MMYFGGGSRHFPPEVVITPFGESMGGQTQGMINAPASGTWGVAAGGLFMPMSLLEPYPCAKAFWMNGASIGIDYFDIGVYRMTDPATGRLDLIRSTGQVMSAVTASVVQEAGWPQVGAFNSGTLTDSTDRTSYTTGTLSLAAGKLYVLSVENSHATAAVAPTSIDNGPTFTKRSFTAYNTNLNYLSVWTAVPTTNYTGTLVINFGATTITGCVISIDEFSGVDTTTNDGVVQQATGTGSSVTPLATLAAFGSVYNAAFGAHGHAAVTATTQKTGFTKLSDGQAATPAQALETEYLPANDTAVNATITSAAWGSCAIEIKAAAAPATPWRIARTQLAAAGDSTDSTTYTTASVTLKAGRLYLLSVENSHASSAAAVSSITGGSAGIPTFTSRSTVQYNSSLNRTSIWSARPSADYTGTVVINFGGAQTGAVWSLLEMSGVDTTTTDGVVQQATGTGTSTVPNVSLAAFADARNATFIAIGKAAAAALTVAPGFTKMNDTTAATPAQSLGTEWRGDNHRSPWGTISSVAWGACAVEIDCDVSPFIIPAAPQTGSTDIYMGFVCSSTTAQIFRTSNSWNAASGMLFNSAAFPLPSTVVPVAVGANASRRPVAGFTLRTLIG